MRKSINCRNSLKILNRLTFEIVSSEKIRLLTFSNKLKLNNPNPMVVCNWDSQNSHSSKRSLSSGKQVLSLFETTGNGHLKFMRKTSVTEFQVLRQKLGCSKY